MATFNVLNFCIKYHGSMRKLFVSANMKVFFIYFRPFQNIVISLTNVYCSCNCPILLLFTKKPMRKWKDLVNVREDHENKYILCLCLCPKNVSVTHQCCIKMSIGIDDMTVHVIAMSYPSDFRPFRFNKSLRSYHHDQLEVARWIGNV